MSAATNGAASAPGAWAERWRPLCEEWVIVAAHRQGRPWIGQAVRAWIGYANAVIAAQVGAVLPAVLCEHGMAPDAAA